MKQDKIIIKGARVHNLKNVSLELPRNAFIVFTGISGSGKSSLAFDTIYAEGQRRYVESLSSYARQFLGLMDKPDVDQIDGLSPAISIDQKTTSHNPRSTVGTVTEIYDYLRLLYAKIGIPHCPQCGKPVRKQTIEQIVNRILELPLDTQVLLLGPIVKDKKGEHKGIIPEIKRAGYTRIRFDCTVYTLEEFEDKEVDKKKKHNLEVVVDRINVRKEERQRITESLEQALDWGNGIVVVSNITGDEEQVFSLNFSCADCGINLSEPEPRSFSFNSPHGACPDCSGIGTKLEVDPALIIPNPRLTLAEGAIRPWSKTVSHQGWYYRILEQLSKEYGFSINTPIGKLPKKAVEIILYGTGDKTYQIDYQSERFTGDARATFEGVINNLERRHKETDSDFIRSEIEYYMRVRVCPTCSGKRLKKEALAVTVSGMSISQITSMSIEHARDFFNKFGKKVKGKASLSDRDLKISNQIIKEIRGRLAFLHNVGLDYLTLDRSVVTLAGGEAQRIRLATQIGSSLTGVLYVLDEPSIGLHQRDNDRLIDTLKKLRDLGNTVLVVEHDESTIMEADHLVDIGPGAGEKGGEIVAEGTPLQVKKNKKSLTGRYLSGQLKIEVPEKLCCGNGKKITIKGAKAFNLKNVDVDIPLGRFVAITGVSGSGKSTLMTEILAKALSKKFYNAKDEPAEHDSIVGTENIDKVIDIDQSPIGRTPRSNPATYTGLFTPVRELYASLPEAKVRGYNPGRFSFNVTGGRCEACKGEGLVKIEMQFLPDVYVVCEECRGRRYNREALEIHYNGKDISEILNMTVDEAVGFFKRIPVVYDKLKTLQEVGLGYIKLGQSATTLSGGEAQRVKLASELSRRATGKTIYILDEPTTGLHFDDVKKLLKVLRQLVEKGNTVLIIEHNMDVIKSVDWVIDMGPEGGEHGGEVVAQGTPKNVAQNNKSHTGRYLKKILLIK